jgi:DNA-binding NtrC family response regulator
MYDSSYKQQETHRYVSKAVTILFVDDDPYIRKVLCAYLQRSGFDVLSAADGRDGLDAARRSKADIRLLISDVMMPGMPGPELANALQICRPGIKVLLISASADFEPPAQENWGFLRKPFAPAVLLQKVREMLPELQEDGRQPADERLCRRMREARAEYVRYSQEYDLLLALTGDPSVADSTRRQALRQAAEARKSTLRAYSESVRQFADFLRVRQLPDGSRTKAAT